MIELSDFQDVCKPRQALPYVTNEERKALAAHYGGTHLFPYIAPFSRKEDDEKQKWRCGRTVDHYENYVQEIGATYIEGVYRTGQVSRTCGNGALDAYLKTDYDTWFQTEAAAKHLLIPEAFIFLYHSEDAADVRTEADANTLKAWPRPSLVHGSEVLNYELDEDGCVEWVSRKMQEGTEQWVEVVDDTNIYRFTGDGRLMGAGEPHNFVRRNAEGKVVPACPVVFKPWRLDVSGAGLAFMQPVIHKALACLQVMAMLVETSYFGLHFQMVVDRPTFDEMVKTGVGNGLPIVVDTTGAPQDKTIDPHFLQPPSVPMDKLIELAYDKIPKAIYRAARVRDRSTDKSLSGVSKLMDAVPEMAALSGIANYLQSVDAEVCNILCATFSPSLDCVVQYPIRFDLETPADTLEQIQAVGIAMDKGGVSAPTLLKELMKKVARGLLPDADEKMIAKIDKEIDAEKPPVPTAAPALETKQSKVQMPVMPGADGNMNAGIAGGI